jgi:hypothetical protein
MAIHLFKTATFYKSGRDGGHLETLEWGLEMSFFLLVVYKSP